MNKISTFGAKALCLELVESINSRQRAFVRIIEILFIAQVVSRSLDTFAAVVTLEYFITPLLTHSFNNA